MKNKQLAKGIWEYTTSQDMEVTLMSKKEIDYEIKQIKKELKLLPQNSILKNYIIGMINE